MVDTADVHRYGLSREVTLVLPEDLASISRGSMLSFSQAH